MNSPPPFTGKLVSAREKAIEELVQGRESAAQLELVFHDQLTGTAYESTTTAKDLVTKMLRSFTESLSILGYTEPSKASAATSLPSWKQLRKKSKRREMQETTTTITSAPNEDGYVWRKYGQKEILNTKHLRCYYRCSYKFDHGCQARKQVQRTEDEPPMFCTKYVGHHTCQDILKATLGMDSTAEEGVLLSFKLNTTTKQGEEGYKPIFSPSFSSSLPPSSEELYKKSIIPSIGEEGYKPIFSPSFSSSLPSPSVEHYKKSIIPSIGEEGYKPILSPECLPPTQNLNTKFKSSLSPPSMLPSTSKSGPEDLVSWSSSSSSSSSSFDTDIDLVNSVCFNNAFYDEEWF